MTVRRDRWLMISIAVFLIAALVGADSSGFLDDMQVQLCDARDFFAAMAGQTAGSCP